MEDKRPYVMSIAGYDPSGGAGVLADVKVFEQHRTYGFAVITSNTFQNDSEVKDVIWISISDIKKQIDIILDKFPVNVFKIGIVENSETLSEIKTHILHKNPKALIIWDTVLATSSGFKTFENKGTLSELLNGMYCITPNLPEFNELIGSEEKAFIISEATAIYLKGGHSDNKGVDELFYQGEKKIFGPKTMEIRAKHGSGCILSSSIAANLALGKELKEACSLAKNYTEERLASNSTLLAYHN